MTAFLFHNFSISSYELISKVDGKEAVYRKNDKLAILIEDEDVGKSVFDVVKSLKEWGETISSDHVSFKVTNYVADKYDTVQILFAEVNLNFENDWERSSKLDKLQELVSFVYAMQEKGYLLDTSSFNNENCRNISDFLSFFKPNGHEAENSNSCIIKYVHYVLASGIDFDGLYQPIVRDNIIYAIKKFPYYMPVIQMCYNYCANGIVPDDIKQVIQEEKRERQLDDQPYYNYLVVGNPDLSATLPVTEENETYTVYAESVKIFKKLSSDFEEFLKDENDFFWHVRKQVREDFTNVIIDFQGNIIGYMYKLQEIREPHTVLDTTLENQKEIVEFVSKLYEYLSDIRSKRDFDFVDNQSNFNLESDLIYSLHDNEFKIAKLEDLFKLVTDDGDELSRNITELFFKLLLAYIEKTYGKISNKKSFLEKKEVRYLTPVVAKEFVSFALGNSSYISNDAVEAFLNFSSNMKCAEDGLLYDTNFQYNPSESVPFVFEYEAESKYGIEIQKGMSEKLPDDRVLVTFKRRKCISTLENDIQSVKNEIRNKIGRMNKYVNLTDITEIIYSEEIGSDGVYLVTGYVTTPIKGIPLTNDIIYGFDNREILKFAGKLMSNFGRYYIEYSQILIDIIHDDDKDEDDFTFYINIMDANFSVRRSYSDGQKEFVENFFAGLRNNGYNRNAFVGIDFSGYYTIENYLISKAEAMDAFCTEHQIYYDSYNNMCPVCAKTKVVLPEGFEERNQKVFEDQYAVHYKSGWDMCVKIYKQDSVDMKQIEENIDFILTGSDYDRKQLLGQDCFIPYKKALNSNREFIGYTYEYVDFASEGFTDLKDTENLENLPRLMSLVRLIMQVKKSMDYELGFIRNPFGSVFLSKNHKKQVQIVNVEFLQKGRKTGATKKWLYKYICQVLDSDSYIEIDVSKLPDNLDFVLRTLKECAQELKMYCPIHRIYYKSTLLFCPKCVDSKQFEKIKIEYVNESELSEREYFNQGGESTLYLYDGGCIAKVFKDTVNYSFKCKILSAIFAKKEILEQINSESHKFRFIIPKRLLVDRNSNKILGYIMDEKVEGSSISALRDKVEVRNLGFSRKDVMEILITVGEGIQTLHDKANIYIGDLNGRNILVDKDKNVYFLDFDGMGIENIAPTFCTEGYIDPVSQKNKNITKKDDWYSFAIQAFYYLTFTHPFNGIYEEGNKTLDIPDKMERRISLLGNHGIQAPAIAESWDWMNIDLIRVFRDTFESNTRKNIVPELQKQYSEMYGGKFYQPDNETIQISSKFIAEKNNLFNGEIVRIINNYSAICRIGDNYSVIVSVRGSEYNIPFTNCMDIRDILILEDYPIVFAVYQYRISGFHVNSDTEIFSEGFDDERQTDHVVINKNTLYLAKREYGGENVILQISFNSNGEESRETIKFLSKNSTLAFLSKFNSKFMLVKRNLDGTDEIYCNSEKLCDIEFGQTDSKYNILYDDTTKMWLVIDNKGNLITIKASNGKHKMLKIPENISDMNVERAVFNKGILYIPSTDCLYIIKVNDQVSTKRMECNKIMTPDSRLYNFNANGFSVVTGHTFYDVHKA